MLLSDSVGGTQNALVVRYDVARCSAATTGSLLAGATKARTNHAHYQTQLELYTRQRAHTRTNYKRPARGSGKVAFLGS